LNEQERSVVERLSDSVVWAGRYTIATGLEVRAGYSADDIVRTQLTPEIDTAQSIAAGWRQTLIDNGFRSLV
jgi:hypothetical protein